MKIAVVAVAAERSGALSVLKDFHSYVYSNSNDHNWTFYTSIVDLPAKENINIIKTPWIKKSWVHRSIWELFFSWIINRKNDYDVVISLQNTAISCNKAYSVAYFHNMLLLQDEYKFSLFKKDERLYAVYRQFIAPITLRTLSKADLVICQTETVKKKLSYKIKTNSIIVIPPKIELSNSDIGVNHYNQNNRNFFYPAEAYKFKNHDIIVKAARYLVEIKKLEDFNIFFTFKEDSNDYAKHIYNMSKGLPQIKFLGYLSRESLIEMYYKNTLIITSKIESYPIPLVEAMSIGAPIVALGYDYVNEITKCYDRKYIGLKGEYKGLADIMIESMKDVHHRNQAKEMTDVNSDSMARIINEIERNTINKSCK